MIVLIEGVIVAGWAPIVEYSRTFKDIREEGN